MSDKLYDVTGTELGIVDPIESIITGDLPKVFIASDTAFTDITKETASEGTLTFVDRKSKFEAPIKFKAQGSGSLVFRKKNLNITFYTDDTYDKKKKIKFNSWSPVSKIHLKANEFDISMVRNSCGTKFTYQMMGKNLPQGAVGYIDSFPVILYYNDEYMGCYTWNLPQDGKTYNFTGKKEKACTNLAYRCGDTTIDWNVSSYWEYRGDEDETTAMRSVFTSLHSIMINTANLTTEVIESHFDKETLLSYWVLADALLAVDSLINNWTIVTWDGNIWYHTWYDMDIILGIAGTADSSNRTLSATYDIANCAQYRNCAFWQKIVELYPTEISAMYAKMRANGLDADTIYNLFHDFQSTWGWQNIDADRIKWASEKQTTLDIDKTWLTNRLAYLDNKYGYVE